MERGKSRYLVRRSHMHIRAFCDTNRSFYLFLSRFMSGNCWKCCVLKTDFHIWNNWIHLVFEKCNDFHIQYGFVSARQRYRCRTVSDICYRYSPSQLDHVDLEKWSGNGWGFLFYSTSSYLFVTKRDRYIWKKIFAKTGRRRGVLVTCWTATVKWANSNCSSHYYLHFQINVPGERGMKPLSPFGNELNSSTTVLLQFFRFSIPLYSTLDHIK